MNQIQPDLGVSETARTHNIGFLLLKNFNMISLASAIEPLHMANQLSGKALYSWYNLTADGEPVRASDGIQIPPDGAMTDVVDLDTVIVAGGVNITCSYSMRELSWLRSQARKGRKLGGWTIPIIIIAILATITWRSTHELEPSKPLESDVKPMTIEVVSLDWKWLFIYPAFTKLNV